MNSLVACLVLMTVVLAEGVEYNVVDNGATGDGSKDDSEAFNKTWQLACDDNGSQGTPSVFVPGGKKFLLKPTSFSGPCKSNGVRFEINGHLTAPTLKEDWVDCTAKSWLSFSNINNLVVKGSGIVDGRGQPWWNKIRMMEEGHSCGDRPDALSFNNCDGLVLEGLHHVNSPKIHIGIVGCQAATLSNFHISAPADSPNTDGIDIIDSTNIAIHSATIQTGDDCIAINDNTTNVNITGVECGPGHGISIGSLGCNGKYSTVENVHVQNCSFSGTMYGARIKTCQGGYGKVTNVTYEDITLENAGNPIIIDQFYKNTLAGLKLRKLSTKGGNSSNLVVKGVTYNGFRGTCSTDEAITLKCGQPGCSDITISNVNITASDQRKALTTYCSNSSGKSTSTVPEVKCLSQM